MSSTPQFTEVTLAGQLLASYEQHPRFRFAMPPLVVDPRTLAAFVDSYLLVRSYGGSLDSQQLSRSREQCSQRLTAIFAQLGSQAVDAHESRFLTELRAECLRLLNEELTYYGASPMGRSIAFGSEHAQANALALKRDLHFFDRLPEATTKQILELGAADLARFREAARNGRLQREDLSVSTGRPIKEIVRLLNGEFRSQGVNDCVSAYMGRRMSVTGLALELSVPQATWWANSYQGLVRPPRTLYAHLDESVLFPKSIVYLSDVDRTNGPTSCYPGALEALNLNPLQALVGRVLANIGNAPDSPLRTFYEKKYHQSMSSEPFRRHFMRLPPEIRFNTHFGWDVLPDSDVEASLQARESYMTGGVGTYIVFDGARLLHRGGMLERGERIALQVIFSDLTVVHRVKRKLKAVLQ